MAGHILVIDQGAASTRAIASGETVSDPLADTTSIRAMAGDQQSAPAGKVGLASGLAGAIDGAGRIIPRDAGDAAVPPRHGLLTIAADQSGGRSVHAREGSIFSAGALHRGERAP